MNSFYIFHDYDLVVWFLINQIFWYRNSHFLSEHQIEDKTNDSKHNAHSWEYTVGDEELHCHSLMLMSPRSASRTCAYNTYTRKYIHVMYVQVSNLYKQYVSLAVM